MSEPNYTAMAVEELVEPLKDIKDELEEIKRAMVIIAENTKKELKGY